MKCTKNGHPNIDAKIHEYNVPLQRGDKVLKITETWISTMRIPYMTRRQKNIPRQEEIASGSGISTLKVLGQSAQLPPVKMPRCEVVPRWKKQHLP